jgi:hypothetical protein
MSRKPDIFTTLAMHALYLRGVSIAGVADVFGVSRQSVFTRFKRRNLHTRKSAPAPTQEYNGVKYTRRSNGYYAETCGLRRFMHRVVWESNFGPIPTGWDVHHLDGDRTNNAPSNLAVLPKSEHTRLHGFRNNQYTKKKCHA